MRRITLAVALATGVVGWLSVAGGYPSRWSPGSLVVVALGLPIFSVFEGHGLVVKYLGSIVSFSLPMALATYLWLAHARKNRSELPVRSLVLGGVTAVAAPWHLITSWDLGVQYQGYEEVTSMVAQSAAGLVLTIALGVWSWLKPSLRANLLFHATLFLWLAWCAFPWLGETL